ncbi:GNAT family N-acetyltransferase [Saccharibacillus sp. CPCC 101409]|uniref:GNAT family N-acetyltransferase n=1 Tax=Saccharibacillus sp. CPCC 101409 TaxID=3058041 RepID=UPI002672260B|nr:GNAT family N-acetyltransferase [Saccharibacillus sp. CPCC 101409]MDO3411444.1 GNAT family N-acetyltransferase [Saccharibacillus sp. CPCC 101409]
MNQADFSSYEKSCFVYRDNKPERLTIRNYREDDIEALIRIQRECFPPPYPSELWWNREQLLNHLRRFPQGMLCAEIGGAVVGSLTTMIASIDLTAPDRLRHTWAEMTDNGYIGTHAPDGNTLYVVDIGVSPSARGLGLGKQMLQAAYELVVELGLDRLLGGARMPGYGRAAAELTPEEYVEAVLSGERRDPVVGFLLRCGRLPVAVARDYLDDEESAGCALLMEWRNPFRHSADVRPDAFPL